MSFLVITRKPGESLILRAGNQSVQLVIRKVTSNEAKIGYSASCAVKINTGLTMLSVSSSEPVIIKHSGNDFEISGLKNELGNPVYVSCSFLEVKRGHLKLGVQAESCVEIMRDELLLTEVEV
tara:strand:+ start:8965 stop:9333 length:369 start_codon:yes stop_codon:yes gene_type:complete